MLSKFKNVLGGGPPNKREPSLVLPTIHTLGTRWFPSLDHFLICRDGPVCSSNFIWDFGKLPFPSHLGKYIIKIGKKSTKIHEIGKIKAIFGLGMTPIYSCKNDQIKSLWSDQAFVYRWMDILTRWTL